MAITRWRKLDILGEIYDILTIGANEKTKGD